MKAFKLTDRYTPRSTKAAANYFTDIEKISMITPDEECELARKAAEGDEESRDRLVTANLRFVLSVAKMYTRDPEIYQDLVSAGNIGLVYAASRFDYTKGFKFISYAVWHIRKEMIHYLIENGRTVKLPANRNQLMRVINEVYREIEVKEERTPTEEEILEVIHDRSDAAPYGGKNLDKSTLLTLFMAEKRASSLDKPLGEGESKTLVDLISQDGNNLEDIIMKSDADVAIKCLFSPLSDREKEIVLRRNGLWDDMGVSETFQSIGEKIGISTEVCRLVYKKAIKKTQLAASKNGISSSDLI